MSSTVLVTDVLTNDFPVISVEDILTQYAVGVIESVQDKSIIILAFRLSENENQGILLVCYA